MIVSAFSFLADKAFCCSLLDGHATTDPFGKIGVGGILLALYTCGKSLGFRRQTISPSQQEKVLDRTEIDFRSF
jgi:hypothetical protein